MGAQIDRLLQTAMKFFHAQRLRTCPGLLSLVPRLLRHPCGRGASQNRLATPMLLSLLLGVVVKWTIQKDKLMKTRAGQKQRQAGMVQHGDFEQRCSSGPHSLRNAIAFHLARHVPGRIVLHLTCLLRDAKPSWHWAAIRRQLGCNERN